MKINVINNNDVKKVHIEFLFFVIILILFSCHYNRTNKQPGNMFDEKLKYKDIIELENNIVVLKISLYGGAYFDFHFKDFPMNPINWVCRDTTQPPFKGHFICFDRWGPPSEAEKKNGFMHHGEVNSLKWEIITPPERRNGSIFCEMKCFLPMGGLQLVRKIELYENSPVFHVTEEIKNLNKYGRMFNIVQHVTIAPPFLDTNTLIDNNTEKGFEDKENGQLDQEEPLLIWPEVYHNGEKISLRQFKNEWPRVSSFIFNQEQKYGWVTASSTKQNLLIGYIWEVRDYPWINFWRSMENKMPVAYGMEFGTTGLHEAFPVVAKKGKIFNQNIYEFIDADEVISKSFTAFIAKLPEDYKGVEIVKIEDSLLLIKEKNVPSRDILYHIKIDNKK